MKKTRTIAFTLLLLAALLFSLGGSALAVVAEYSVYQSASFSQNQSGRYEYAATKVDSEAYFCGATKMTSDDLPSGLNWGWEKSDFYIYGTPSGYGQYNYEFVLDLTDDYGSQYTVTLEITLEIKAAPVGSEPKITKDPTGETVSAGGSCYFVARGENVGEYEWFFKSPDYYYALTENDALSELPGLVITGAHSTTLSLSNIPAAMNGWSVYCVLLNDYGEVSTKSAGINVRAATPKPTATPAPTAQPTPAPTPEPTPAPSAEPEPTPEPTPIPTPAHEHSFSTIWSYDNDTHWHACDCGEMKDRAFHDIDEWMTKSDGTQLGICTVCGAVVTGTSTATPAPSGGGRSGGGGNLLIGIVIAAGALLIILAVVLYVVLNKRDAGGNNRNDDYRRRR